MSRVLPIAREGWPVIAMAAGVLGLVAVVGTAAGHPASIVPLVIGLALCLNFFRDPERAAPPGEYRVVSPADGRVVAVVPEREDRFLGTTATRISIFMSPLNVHVNRNPVSGTVERVQHTNGKFRAAFADKASLDNERNALHLRTSAGIDVTCVQIAGLVARRILCYVKTGDRLTRGQRYGFIRFGSRLDVYLPPDATPRASVGDRVHATESILAELN